MKILIANYCTRLHVSRSFQIIFVNKTEQSTLKIIVLFLFFIFLTKLVRTNLSKLFTFTLQESIFV